MAKGPAIPLADALSAATELLGELAPRVQRAEVAGSIRRRRPKVGDIELLVEPRTVAADLFGAPGPDLDPIRDWARRRHRRNRLPKAGDRYIRLELRQGIAVDLFICHPPAEWGSLLAIRTGPARLGHWAVMRMIEFGLRHRNGHVERVDGTLVPTPEERDFFAAARLPCLPPAERDSPAAFEPLAEDRIATVAP